MMNKNLFWIFLVVLTVVFSCKKDDEESNETPLVPSDINMVFVKSDVSCFGGDDGSIDITVKGGTLPYFYAWSNGSTNEDQTGLTAGSYIVSILDAKGSLLVDTIMITEPSIIDITESYLPDTLVISVSGGTPPYSYMWSTGDTTEYLADYDYSACSVTVTDANDCFVYAEFPGIVILDGIYIVGDACNQSIPNVEAMMAVTRNQVTQAERASLFEIYIPLMAGTQGFNIVKVMGANQTLYGPDDSWGVVTNPTVDEPKDVPIQRGSVHESSLFFNVEENGMYHVVIDMELMIATVCQVHWGVIGQATPSGWNTSTALSEPAYNPNSMTWEINDLELQGGDWKFRYSNGWKIDLSTGGADIVAVNTNFGGAIDQLVPGAYNFVNDNPGMYTISMNYTLGSGYNAIATKTGDLPYTNWTSVVCDIVGDGVSADNPNAIVPDPSNWAWGNKLIADNAGVPTINGFVYTWTWTSVILEADAGFKIRTEDGEVPPVGGANFDAGFGNLDIANSSTHVVDAGGNLSVDLKGAYTIKLEIDAADSDVKIITITEG